VRNASEQIEYSEYISILKYLILNICTFSIYQYVWIYRQWSYLVSNKKIYASPVKRTAYSSITFGSLFYNANKHIDNKAVKIILSIIYGIFYFVICACAVITENTFISFLTVLSTLPLVVMQNNQFEVSDQEKPKRRNKKRHNVILALLLVITIIVLINDMNRFLNSLV
jgi:hypothetical protein